MLKKVLIYALVGIATIVGIALVLNLVMTVMVGARPPPPPGTYREKSTMPRGAWSC